MNPELNKEETVEVIKVQHPVFTVTKTSKYLALLLFVLLPFLGGYIGYVYAPEKVVEVIREVPQQNKVAEEAAATEKTTSVVVEQIMWASRLKVYDDNTVAVMPYIDFASATVSPITNFTLPTAWTVSFSEQTSPAESKIIKFQDPDLLGKPDSDAVGAYAALSFTRAASCEETFTYKNNPGFLNYNEELSTEEVRLFSSDWVTNRTMGSVPLKELCIENINDYHDVIIMTLQPLTEENKIVLDNVVQSINSELLKQK